MNQNQKELLFLQHAVDMARAARKHMIQKVAAGGKIADVTAIRKLDMGIKHCEDEIRRSVC
jgi:hypothetical protein